MRWGRRGGGRGGGALKPRRAETRGRKCVAEAAVGAGGCVGAGDVELASAWTGHVVPHAMRYAIRGTVRFHDGGGGGDAEMVCTTTSCYPRSVGCARGTATRRSSGWAGRAGISFDTRWWTADGGMDGRLEASEKGGLGGWLCRHHQAPRHLTKWPDGEAASSSTPAAMA